MATLSDVSILIVSWNARDLLRQCIASIAALPCQVVVVDNASADGSADAIAREFPGVTLVRAPTNLGFAGGVNRARREARGQFLLLLNPDTTATPDAIDALVAAFDADVCAMRDVRGVAPMPHLPTAESASKNVDVAACSAAGDRTAASRAAVGDTAAGTGAIAAVGARLVHAGDGTPQAGFNVRRFPTLGSLAMDLLLVDQIWSDNPITRHYLAKDVRDDEAADVDQPAAACLMIRAAAFDAVGGMDERFHPAWFEDVDLCRRLRAAGFRIRYEPRATIAHHGGVAMRTLGLGRFSSIWYANMERYVRKQHGVAAWLLIKALIAAGMIARVLVSLLRADGAAARAYAAVLGQTLTRWDAAAAPARAAATGQ